MALERARGRPRAQVNPHNVDEGTQETGGKSGEIMGQQVRKVRTGMAGSPEEGLPEVVVRGPNKGEDRFSMSLRERAKSGSVGHSGREQQRSG